MKSFFHDNKQNIWFWIFIGLIAILLFLFPILSLDAGNSGDEDTWQHPHAEKVYNYYSSFGSDTTYKEVPEMNPYGMWYELIPTSICKIFDIDNYNTVRHICNSLMGFVALFFAALLSKQFGGWRAAIITLLLLLCSPRFLGHSFNNPKDVPFAAMFIMSIYFITKFIKEYPKPSIKTTCCLAVAIGLALGVRIGGLLLYAYLGFFVLLYYLIFAKSSGYFNKKNTKVFGKYFLYCLIIGAVSFVISIVFWPYMLEAPIKNMVDTFNTMSQYVVSIRQMFEGSLQWSDVLPGYYTPKYILMTIPIAVIVGLILFFVFCWRKKEDRFWSFVVFFTFFFPVFWIVFTNANVYGGWRHAMFAYPPMVVAAALGFEGVIRAVENKMIKKGK